MIRPPENGNEIKPHFHFLFSLYYFSHISKISLISLIFLYNSTHILNAYYMFDAIAPDFALLLTSAGLFALLNIIMIDLVMSGDNAILIGMATKKLQ